MKDALELIKRGTVELISEEELMTKLKRGKPLRIKAGFDPTAPDLHLGHVVLLQKLHQFQELGHHILFLIGDFTATIGDPSGRNETRPQLTKEEIAANIKTYKDQVFKVLDKKKTEVVYNSKWMDKQSAADIIRLSSHYNVARMLERDDFEKRYKAGQTLAIHEFLYPLVQGYDSVALEADVELGGTDQKFNLLVGRHMQREYGQEPQCILTLPLLVGTDGVQKMSKSYDNAIGIQEPAQDIYGKVMSISDDLMWEYYTLLTDRSTDEILEMKKDVSTDKLHPKEAKARLAAELTTRFHSESAAKEAANEFERVFASKQLPSEIEEFQIKTQNSEYPLIQAITESGMTPSKSEARRMIEQVGVRVNEEKVSDIKTALPTKDTHLLQVGKRRFKRVSFA